MDISEVARRSGVAASTLRFYEERGLISSIGRHGLKRVFADSVLERLALIALGRSVGFSLEEIAPMLGTAGTRPKIDRKLLAGKAEEIDQSIRKLVAMRDGLRHAAICSAPSHMECPKFQRILGLAASGAFAVAGQVPGAKRRVGKHKSNKHKSNKHKNSKQKGSKQKGSGQKSSGQKSSGQKSSGQKSSTQKNSTQTSSPATRPKTRR
jgi:DNA-binding transcriptional MerR regulator